MSQVAPTAGNGYGVENRKFIGWPILHAAGTGGIYPGGNTT